MDIQRMAAICIIAIFWGVGLYWLYKNYFAPKKKVSAKVVDKQRFIKTLVPKTSAAKYSEQYVVTFLIDGKRKSFYVTELGYGGYKLGQKGLLIYRGSRIINFIS